MSIEDSQPSLINPNLIDLQDFKTSLVKLPKITPVSITPVEPLKHVSSLAPFQPSPNQMKEAGNIVKHQAMISSQTSIASLWIANRENERGLHIEQEVSVSRFLFDRTARARLTITTW